MNVFVVIPVHNRINFTRKCLLCLTSQRYSDFKIIIVDDGSSDGTNEMIKEMFPHVILLRGNGDFWWTKSVNLGIKYALRNNADIIITLNDDVEIEEDYISSLIKAHLENPDSIIGSASYEIDNKKKCIYCGESIDWFYAKYKKNKVVKSKQYYKSDFLPARGLLIPREIFNKIGLFDEEKFPQTCADYDFVYNAKKNGFKILCNLSSKIFYHKNKSGIAIFKRKKDFYNYFFSKKSAANLLYRLKFGIKNCPKIALAFFIFFDFLKLTYSYYKNK